ncbi:hypothetical protein [Pararhizobium gei]|uniref:hypothetical protein n=1 Tax=Pararhizobium gei TaxID=1395951 RepID=UPI0023DA1D4F|nr:hypothetical protein [Rhizobium gei]
MQFSLPSDIAGSLMALLSALTLSFAIGFSWNRFCRIFRQATSQTILLSPATQLAGAVSVSAAALAAGGNPPVTASAIVALGLVLSVLLSQMMLRPAIQIALASVSLLAHAALPNAL